MRKRAAMAGAVSALVLLIIGAAGSSSIGPSQKSPPNSPPRIYYVATDGNDSFDGLAPARQKGSRGPFRTLKRAARAVMAGDTVQIRAGTYSASRPGMAERDAVDPITVTNFGGEAVIIDGADRTPPAANTTSFSGLRRLVCSRRSGVPLLHGTVWPSRRALHGRNVYAHHKGFRPLHVGLTRPIADCRASDNSLTTSASSPHRTGVSASALLPPSIHDDPRLRGLEQLGRGPFDFRSQHSPSKIASRTTTTRTIYISDQALAVPEEPELLHTGQPDPGLCFARTGSCRRRSRILRRRTIWSSTTWSGRREVLRGGGAARL